MPEIRAYEATGKTWSPTPVGARVHAAHHALIARLRAENLNCMEARRKALARSEEVIMELRADLYKQTSCHQRDLEEATRLRLAIEELKKDVVHAADERDKLRAEVEELRKNVAKPSDLALVLNAEKLVQERDELRFKRDYLDEQLGFTQKERDEARAALRNFVREHLEEIHDVSDEYCRLCIEARRIPARRLDNRRGARTP